MSNGAGVNRRRGYDARLGPLPERTHEVTDQTVQRGRIGGRGRRTDDMRGRVVVDSHRPAPRVVTIVHVRGDRRHANCAERDDRG